MEEKQSELNLSNEKSSEWSFLSIKTETTKLDLSGTNIDNDSSQAIANLKNLRMLNISDASITDLTFLESCKELEEIDISGTDVSDITAFQEIPKLQTEEISYFQKNQT